MKTREKPHYPEFISLAAALDHPVNLVHNGKGHTTYFRIESMERGLKILSRATQSQRINRGKTFFEGLEYRQRLGQGMHDRGEAFVFADHRMEDQKDLAGLANHLPVYARAVSIAEKTVAAGETWDLTLLAAEWSAPEREEMYSIVNIGKLTLEQDARIIVRGNILILTCQELIKKGPSRYEYDIGILGTPHGFGRRNGDFNGNDGDSGKNGEPGEQGVHPSVTANFLGKEIPDHFNPERLNGKAGGNGENGKDGEDALNGGACKIAEINLRSIVSTIPVIIGVIPGDGGNGGNGGNGGDGGNGGNGIDAVKTYKGTVGPGKGGLGGAGGDGGNGGRAGHSGISSNVFIEVPEESTGLISCFSRPGKTGIPGKGGLPSKGGAGGTAGRNPDQSSETDTENGGGGQPGKNGRPAKLMPPAKIYLNSEIFL